MSELATAKPAEIKLILQSCHDMLRTLYGHIGKDVPSAVPFEVGRTIGSLKTALEHLRNV